MMPETEKFTARFKHQWATRICRENPWYCRSANRVITVTVDDNEVCSLITVPLLGFGFPDIRVKLSQIVQVEEATYWVELIKYFGYSIPTVRIKYTDDDGAVRFLEHTFTTVGPFSMMSDPSGKREAFVQAIEAGRQQTGGETAPGRG